MMLSRASMSVANCPSSSKMMPMCVRKIPLLDHVHLKRVKWATIRLMTSIVPNRYPPGSGTTGKVDPCGVQ